MVFIERLKKKKNSQSRFSHFNNKQNILNRAKSIQLSQCPITNWNENYTALCQAKLPKCTTLLGTLEKTKIMFCLSSCTDKKFVLHMLAWNKSTILEIKAVHQPMTRRKRYMTGSTFLQPIIHILNHIHIHSQLDDVSLFYKCIFQVKIHTVFYISAFLEGYLKQIYTIKAKTFFQISFDNSTGTKHIIWPLKSLFQALKVFFWPYYQRLKCSFNMFTFMEAKSWLPII